MENKIVSLERQFRVATEWANNTGQGVENPGDFEAAILKRCPLYKALEPIMGERPNSKPSYTNEDSDTENVIDEGNVGNEGDVGNETTVEQSTYKTPAKTVATSQVG